MKIGEPLKLTPDYRRGSLGQFKSNRLDDVMFSNLYESFNRFMNRNRHLNTYRHVEGLTILISISKQMRR